MLKKSRYSARLQHSFTFPVCHHYEQNFLSNIRLHLLPSLNIGFTQPELELGLTKLKSRAVSADGIHNEMLVNLTPTNQTFLLNLFNIMF